MLSTRAIHFAADTPYFPAKTPARGKNRGENAYQGAMTIQNAKGKTNVMRTPFQLKTAEPQRILKDALGQTKTSIHLVNRSSKPLTDKTPFANRTLNIFNTPGPEKKPINFAKPNKEHNPTPDTGSTRASSTRKHPRVPKTVDNRFQTPANQGNHWDVSEGEIVAPEMEQTPETEAQMDYNDEIEYMAPNTLNHAYEPPFDFDLPDYNILGQAASRSFYCYPQDHLPPPTFDFHIGDDDLMKWDSLSLPSLSSDDGSSRLSKHSQNTSAAQTAMKTNVTTTSTFRTVAAATSNARATTRPATAASTRRPATSAAMRPCPPVFSMKSGIRPSSTMAIRGATATTPATSTMTRKPPTTTSRTTTVPKKQPPTRPTSARPTITALPTNSTTTTRPRAVTTTMTRQTTSRPPTSASILRPLTSSSVRTAPPGPTLKSSATVVKPMPAPVAVKKSAKRVVATTQSKVVSTTTTRGPGVSKPPTTKIMTLVRSAAAEYATPTSQSVTKLEVVKDGKGNPLDEKAEERDAHLSSIGPPAETESLEGIDRKVNAIQGEDSFTKEDGARYESHEALDTGFDKVGNEEERPLFFGSGST